MSECVDYERLIERLLADEIDDGDRDRLLAHAGHCAACRSFVDLHYRLLEPDLDLDLPDELAFARARRDVLARIREQRSQQRPGREAARPGAARFAWRGAGWAAAAAVALMALGAAFVAGRATGARVLSLGPGDPAGDVLVREIRREAAGNRGLEDLENSPLAYSNLSFEPLGADRLALRFDVTRHVEVARRTDDPLVRELLAQSLIAPAPVGTRLEAMSYAGRVMDAKIEDALIFAMLNDPNLAVRLKASNLLAAQPPNPEVQSAFITVLGSEESVQLRLQAIDYLASSDAGRERLDAALGQLQPGNDTPLLVRASRYRR